MFSKIYPQREGSLFPAASHMAEEMGEVAEAVMMYRTVHSDDALSRVSLEFADLISCVLGVCNSIASAFPNEETILEEILKRMFANGCHACHGSPCTCAYSYVMTYGEDPSRTRIA
jgi:NTP pyrophosphatase (non-canonical NTP hydrolase)